MTFEELLHGHLISDVPLTHQHNMEILLVAVNKFRTEYNKPFNVTSGYRSELDQERINPSVRHSKHMEGFAVDIADPDGSLYDYALANQDKLKDWGLWCESGTKRTDGHGWLHLQCVQYGSYIDGKSRFFIP